MKEALLYEKLPGGAVKCALCAHRCVIKPGRTGLCMVRLNDGGTLMSLVYGRIISAAVDPVEKKPLYHFLPGSATFSIAVAGCNFRCSFCQNSSISQPMRDGLAAEPPGETATAEAIIDAARASRSRSISYTYTEPTIGMEFFLECAEAARAAGMRNIFVSNGFMSPEAARLIAPVLDAINVDLKGSEEFYKKLCGAHAGPVMDTIALLKSLGVWVEVTTLVIPGLNDSEAWLREAAAFIASVNPGIPWHVSRFHPTYKLTDRPATPLKTLEHAREIGLAEGLKYVYEGNAPGRGSENTRCKMCGTEVISRSGFSVRSIAMRDGACAACGAAVDGVWS